MITVAMTIQDIICSIVKLVTTGLGIRISNVVITPKEIPSARLDDRIIPFWKATIFKTVLGFAPMALKTANS